MLYREIKIIDLGGQYCHLIHRRLRDLDVASEIVGPGVQAESLQNAAGIILSGGPSSVYDSDAPRIDPAIVDLGIPMLGICYGHQLLASLMGGTIARRRGEYGLAKLDVIQPCRLFGQTPTRQKIWMSHRDAITQLPKGAHVVAKTEDCACAAFADNDERLFGVQFHPEVVHTDHGIELLSNFARDICHAHTPRVDQDLVESITAQISRQVGNRRVFFLVSGGVDSTVAFVLCGTALPHDRVLGLHVDTGLMREQETAEFRTNLKALDLLDRVIIRDESERFLSALAGVTEPEKKRHIIGRLFVEIQAEALREHVLDADEWLLGQGTIYPDTIESGGSAGRAAVIKTHHNRVPEIQRLIDEGRVIEPLADFYKDEVRRLGEQLGLDKSLTHRWPFPGPGLAVRCLASNQHGKAVPLEDAHVPAAYKAVRLPLRTVGVQGDSRTYLSVIALAGPLDYEQLLRTSTRLCNAGTRDNRVVVRLAGTDDLSALVMHPGDVNRDRLDLLRAADLIVRRTMERTDLVDSVWQFPIVSLPLGTQGGESIVLRPINSIDGMTANFAQLPKDVVREMAAAIAELPGVDAVFLDVSNKPPATIEWE